MRVLAALLCWLITTALLAITVPIGWVQLNLVDENGFAALSQRAAQDPALQSAVAGELTARVVSLSRQRGLAVDHARVRDISAEYTGGPAFPPRFARAMAGAHRSVLTGGGGEFVIGLAAMLGDSAFQQTLNGVPGSSAAPLAVTAAEPAPDWPLRSLSSWGRWISLGAAVLTGAFALLTLLAARRRGRALTGLGVSALLAGAVGWAGIEVARGYLDDAFANTAGAGRQIAEAMAATGVAGLHQWLNLALAAGGALVVLGVLVATLGGLGRS